jgi:hypothetical protein
MDGFAQALPVAPQTESTLHMHLAAPTAPAQV